MELKQDREPVLILRQPMGETIAHQLDTQHNLRTATQSHVVFQTNAEMVFFVLLGFLAGASKVKLF